MTDTTNENTAPEPTTSAAGESTSGETLGGSVPQGDSVEKDPAEWVSGDDPITGPQKSYLDSLARQAGEELSADMNKAEASQHIERLKEKLGLDA